MNKQLQKQAKFLIRELIAVLDLLDALDYDDELCELLTKLSRRLT